MENTGTTVHMLLLTADPHLVTTLTDLAKELCIETQSSEDCREVSDQLSQKKYEGIVLDFDTVVGARPVLASVRESRSNKNAIVFAVATEAADMEQALHDRAHFLLRRPIDTSSMRRTLHAAYDLMERERRRYFRVRAALPVNVTVVKSTVTFQCSTINVSHEGMALTTSVPFDLAEKLDIALVLPDGFIVRAAAIVIWDDKHGKSGLHFQCGSLEMRHKLDTWLDSQFAKQRGAERL